MTRSLQELFEAWHAGTTSGAEQEEFLRLLALPENKEQALQLIRQAIEADPADGDELSLPAGRLQLILQSIIASDPESIPADDPVVPARTIKLRWFRYAAAIAAILLSSAVLYLTVWKKDGSGKELTSISAIRPGADRAVLKLSDGREILLDSAMKGSLAKDGNVLISKNADGEIVYDARNAAGDDVTINTMTTPKGGQFQLVLPDGTKVWLNAASSLRYPTAFNEDKRIVEMNGEAYFEVKKDPSRPFFVRINGQAEVQVTGTSFNINSYADEPSINTTLIEGSVKLVPDMNAGDISAGGDKAVSLVPGLQARITHTEPAGRGAVATVDIGKADIEKVTAWKNGMFNFEGSKLKDAMRQLARWYDIEVVYDDAVLKKGMQNALLMGGISRSLSLADVLEVLGVLGLHFKMEEGRKLVLLP